jgi:hypothetical protein
MGTIIGFIPETKKEIKAEVIQEKKTKKPTNKKNTKVDE